MTTQKKDNYKPDKPAKQPRDPDFVGAEAAMHRAAALARRRAIAISGSVAVFRDGKIVQDTAATELSVDDTDESGSA